MKKLITITFAVAFAIVLGVAFSTASSAMDKWENGITVFEDSGSALGHIDAAAVDNGVTIFALGSVSTGRYYKEKASPMDELEGSAAGSLRDDRPSRLDLGNGITVF